MFFFKSRKGHFIISCFSVSIITLFLAVKVKAHSANPKNKAANIYCAVLDVSSAAFPFMVI